MSKLKAPKWVADYNEFVAFRNCEHRSFPCECGKRKQDLLCKVADLSDWKTYKYKYCCTIEDDYLKGKPTSSITTTKGTFVFHMRDWTVREDLYDENQIPIMEGTGRPQLMRRRNLVDINFRDEMGWTALHLALVRGYDEIASYLLAKGANVNEANRVGYTPLHVAAQRGSNLVELLERNADVFATNRTFSTPLHLAARGGHVECVKALCEAGSDVSACDADQNTPMHFACWRNDREVIQLLVRYGGSGLFSS